MFRDSGRSNPAAVVFERGAEIVIMVRLGGAPINSICEDTGLVAARPHRQRLGDSTPQGRD